MFLPLIHASGTLLKIQNSAGLSYVSREQKRKLTPLRDRHTQFPKGKNERSIAAFLWIPELGLRPSHIATRAFLLPRIPRSNLSAVGVDRKPWLGELMTQDSLNWRWQAAKISTTGVEATAPALDGETWWTQPIGEIGSFQGDP